MKAENFTLWKITTRRKSIIAIGIVILALFEARFRPGRTGDGAETIEDGLKKPGSCLQKVAKSPHYSFFIQLQL